MRGGGKAVRSCRAAAGGGYIWKFKGGGKNNSRGGKCPPPPPTPKYTPEYGKSMLLVMHQHTVGK